MRGEFEETWRSIGKKPTASATAADECSNNNLNESKSPISASGKELSYFLSLIDEGRQKDSTNNDGVSPIRFSEKQLPLLRQ